MNSEDKKRFERYRKGYIEPNDEFNNTNTNTHKMDEKMTALIRNVEITTIDCIIKTKKDEISVIINAGIRNELIYSE